MLTRTYAILAGGAGALLVASLLVFVGYRAGQRDIEADWDRIEKERAESIVGLAQRYAAADAEASRLRTAAEAATSQRVTGIQREIVKIPVRVGCGHSDAEHRLLLDTFCVRNPGAAQCLYAAVPFVGSPDPGQE